MPIHCSDLTEIIFQVINKNVKETIIECIGPEVISLKEIIKKLLKSIDKKRILISTPLLIAKVLATFSKILPKPMITIDQLKLLKYDNIPSGKFKTNFDLNFPSYSNFDLEIEKYSFVWKESGEFSQAKYKKNS